MTEPTMRTYYNGGREWWVHSKRHRTDGPAVEWSNGDREWWLNGQLHRTDGPAVEYADGDRAWWVHGKRHRTDGPAFERPDGHREWWVDGRYLTPSVQYYVAQGMSDADALTAVLIGLEQGDDLPLPWVAT